MSPIDQHITVLLSSNDCVIIPDFGAFIADYKAPSVDSNHSKKPSKSILFNTHLTRNDGLLINALVENEGLNYQNAKQKIKLYVSEINQTLEQGKSHIIEGIGEFKLDNAGFVQFIESENNTSYLDCYGLPTVKLEKIKRPKATHPNKSKILDYSLKTAAAIALILVVFWASQPSIDTSNTNQASLDFLSESPQKSINKPTDSIVRLQDTTASITTPIAKAKDIVKEIDKTPSYHVIIGSLSTKSAAQLHLNLYRKTYPFEDITILQGNNRYRISAAHFQHLQEANAYIKTLKNLDPKAFKDAWTLYQ